MQDKKISIAFLFSDGGNGEILLGHSKVELFNLWLKNEFIMIFLLWSKRL